MRKLATIQKILDIKPIEGADLICAYKVKGWWVVDKKGAFEKNDLVVYFEIDSWVPTELAPFLSKGKEPSTYNGIKGERLRSQKFKGQMSQGLILKVQGNGPSGTAWNIKKPNGLLYYVSGLQEDVTEILGVVKWEPVLPASLNGDIKGLFPACIPKTVKERIQNLSDKLNELPAHTYEVTEKLHGCFKGNQYIETWDSGTVTIGQIVNGGLRPKLIGVDENGKVVPVEITNVFNNGFKKHWLRIKFDPLEKSGVVGKGGNLNCTINHKIFKSNMTEVSASELKAGDELLMTSVELNDAGIHYINSSMLGDGHIGTNGHYSFNESHATKYPEYLQYVKNIFSKVKTSSRVQTSGYGSEIEHIRVFKTNKIKELRGEWYDDNGIKLPENIDWIDDFSVAKWYMDDGSLAHSDKQNDRACFATNAFSESDVERLRNKLHTLYGVDAVSYKTDKGSLIRVNYSKGTIHNLWEAIAPHVIPEQRYKLPTEYRDYPLTPYPEVTYERVKLPVKVTSVEFQPLPAKSHGFTGYDLETTTHNYFCGGVLVHNSSLTIWLDTDNDFHVCSRNLDLKETESNSYWKAARKYDVEQKMKDLGLKGLAIQGELIGEGINGNQYKTSLDFYVFDMYDAVFQRYLTSSERLMYCEKLGLKHVPVLCNSFNIGVNATVDSLLTYAEGKSELNGSEREGCVFVSTCDPSLSFKTVSNKWLLKNKE